MDEELKRNLSAASLWIRLLFMVLFALILYVSMIVFWVIVVVQFLFSLITGKPNLKLSQFSDVLSQYISQCLQFECFGTEEKPFPFADLPESRISEEVYSAEPEEAHTSELHEQNDVSGLDKTETDKE